MTWEQKFAALNALCRTGLFMRAPGDWYVHADGRCTRDLVSFVMAGTYGNGRTPEAAVDDDWRQVTAEGQYVVINAMRPDRRLVRWNGFMWVDLPVEDCAAPEPDR